MFFQKNETQQSSMRGGTTLKKSINLAKIKNLFQNYSLLLVVQYNNLDRKDWSFMKSQLEKMRKSQVLVIKNTLAEKVVEDLLKETSPFIPKKSMDRIHLFQGPSVVLGCQDVDNLGFLWNFIQTHEKLIFVGGLYQGRLLNHLDIEKLITLDFSIYEKLFDSLGQKTQLDLVLKESMSLNFLDTLNTSFLQCLESMKSVKS